MISQKENQIIELIYDAAINPLLWVKVLEQIAEFTHSSAAIYTYMDQHNLENNFVFTHNISVDSLENYKQKNLNLIDMKLHGEKMNTIGIGYSFSIDGRPYESMHGTDEQIFYEHFLKPSNICFLNGVLLEYDPCKWAMFAIHRSENAQKYSTQDAKIIERFAKHLRRSLKIYRHNIESKEEKYHYLEILENLKVGVILINDKTEIQFCNQHAQTILNQTQSIWIDQKNSFKAMQPYHAKLEQYIWNILNSSCDQSVRYEKGGILCIQKESELPIILTVVPLTNIIKDQVVKLKKTVAIFITQMNKSQRLSPKVLKEIYALSPREIEICELFINGLNLSEIASKCQLTISSIRTYLKTIFSKTNCNSQVELMHLLMNLTINFQYIKPFELVES